MVWAIEELGDYAIELLYDSEMPVLVALVTYKGKKWRWVENN
jgi:hypothetical protein